MNLNCGAKTIKYLILTFNFLFLITGIILVGVGASIKAYYTQYDLFLDAKYFTLPNLFIATGSLIFIISFLGCYGAMKESWILLLTYSFLLGIIFIFEFSAGIAGYVLRDKTSSYLESTMLENKKLYGNKDYEAITKMWDIIQAEFQCCGVTSLSDWQNVNNMTDNKLPLSCCPSKYGTIADFHCYANTTSSPTSPTATTATSTTSELESTTDGESSTITTTNSTPTTDSTTATNSTASTNSTATTNSTSTTNFTITTNFTTTTKSTTTTNPMPATNSTTTNNSTANANSTASTTYSTAPTNRIAATTITGLTSVPTPKEIKSFFPDSTTTTTTPPYEIGCKAAFGDYLKAHAVDIGGVGFALAVIQLIGIGFSSYLSRQLKNSYYST
ncbi:unnamed protein product [Phaedon cochleariae]|uniref:Tetraspanin n=1 Tax=Phaedon cochleariae TaxID=80249 RepID=A0A9P0DRJ1_PHACE|nr:unnamed protein product [Phaedon cochleariae]